METKSSETLYEAAGVQATLVLVSVCLAGILAPLSLTGASTAVPAIGQALGGSATSLSWVVNIYNLTFGSFVMAAGALADQVGRKKIWLSGMGIFVLSSLAAAVSPDLAVLNAARAVQGLGAALALTSGSAILAATFDGESRTRAYGLLGTSFGIGLAIGPLSAGALIQFFGWSSIFWLLAAIGFLTFGIGVRYIKDSRDPEATGIDWPGTLTFSAALAMLTLGVVEGPQMGWSSVPVVALLAGFMAFLASFIAVELRQKRPMLDLSLFRLPRFVAIQILPVATGFGFVALLVFVPLYLIGIDHMSALDAGVMMLALTAPILFMPLIAASLSARLGTGPLLAFGMALVAAGGLLLTGIAPGAPTWKIVAPLLLVGFGVSFPWGLMDAAAISLVPKERAGMAAGIFFTMRVAGEAVAIAILLAVMVSVTKSHLGAGVSAPVAQSVALTDVANRVANGDLTGAVKLFNPAYRLVAAPVVAAAYTHGFHTALVVMAAVSALASVLILIAVRPGRNYHEEKAESVSVGAIASRIGLLSKLTPSQVRLLEQTARIADYQAGSVILDEHRLPDGTAILISGRWQMQRFIRGIGDPAEHISAKMGNWHGGLRTIDLIAPARVTALESTSVLHIPRETVESLTVANPHFAKTFLRGIRGGAELLDQHVLSNKQCAD